MRRKIYLVGVAFSLLSASFSFAESTCSPQPSSSFQLQAVGGSVCSDLKERSEALKKAQEEQIFKGKAGKSPELNKAIQGKPAFQNLQVPQNLQGIPQNVPEMRYNPEEVKTRKEEKQEAKKKEKDFSFFQIPTDAVLAEELSGTAFIVRPEKTTVVKMSASDINRIVCSGEVENEIKVVFPQKKGVNVKVVDSNAFVEFEVKKIGDTYIYQESPVEFYVMCDNSVYSIIAIPQKIPAVTVYLEDRGKVLKKKVESLSGIPFEKRIIEIVKAFFSGRPPFEARYVKVDKEINIFPVLEVRETGNYIFEAEGFVARVFMVSLKKEANATYVDLREKDFLKKEITVNPAAVALKTLRLSKGEKTMVVLIEKRALFSEGEGSFYLMKKEEN